VLRRTKNAQRRSLRSATHATDSTWRGWIPNSRAVTLAVIKDLVAGESGEGGERDSPLSLVALVMRRMTKRNTKRVFSPWKVILVRW